MDFKRLRILRELADRQTVGATAAAMNVTASAVSQQLKALQDELGVVLIERDGRGVRLTEAGKAMAGAAADVATAMARARWTCSATSRPKWPSRRPARVRQGSRHARRGRNQTGPSSRRPGPGAIDFAP